MISMKKKQNLLLVGGAGLSLLLAGVSVVLSGQGNNSLLGEGAYPSAKAMTITFTADDFKAGAKTITKNGNPFSVTGDVTVTGDVITFKQGASLTRAAMADATASANGWRGANGGSLFYEMEIDGLTVAKPSQKVVHAGSTRTWFEVINNRGDGAGRGLYSTAAEADKVGYENLHHVWTNNRDNDDPSSFWIETNNPTLTSEEGTFSFKSITYKYACTAVDNEYSKIMANAKRDGFRFTDKEGKTLPALAPIGGKLEFKVELDPFFAKQYDYTVTVSSDRAETGRKTLTADASGVYSITVAKQYDTSVKDTGYTYIHLNATEKVGTEIKTEADLKAMKADGVYYLANDIMLTSEDPLELATFSGVLNGKGHRIYTRKGVRTGWGDIRKGLLFHELTGGIVKNLELEFCTNWVHQSVSGIAGTMNGGLVEDVTIREVFGCFSYGSAAAVACAMNDGIIRNSTIYFASETFDSQTNDGKNYTPMAVIVGDAYGGSIENITVRLPAPVDSSKLNLVRNGADKVKNCRIIKDEKKLYDSALASPVATERTFAGLPVTKMDVTNGGGGSLLRGDILDFKDGVTSLSFYCCAEDYLYNGTENRDTFPISSNSTFVLQSTSGRVIWNYFEIRIIGGNPFIRSVPLLNDVNTKGLGYAGATQTSPIEGERFGYLYDWATASTVTMYATPVYCH